MPKFVTFHLFLCEFARLILLHLGNEDAKSTAATPRDSDKDFKILPRWRQMKPESVDDDDLSLPDIPSVAPEVVKLESTLRHPNSQRRILRSGVDSTDNQLSDSDRFTTSSKGTNSSRGSKTSKGKSGGRGGKAKTKSQQHEVVAESKSAPRAEKKIEHGLVKKGALQAALKLNQERSVHNQEAEIVEMRPTSTSVPKHQEPREEHGKPSVKEEQSMPVTDIGLDDDIIIDVEMTPVEISLIDKVSSSVYYFVICKLKDRFVLIASRREKI